MWREEWNRATLAMGGSIRIVRLAMIGCWNSLAAIWLPTAPVLPDHDGKPPLVDPPLGVSPASEQTEKETHLLRLFSQNETYRDYFPHPQSAIEQVPGWFTAEQIRACYCDGVDPCHLGWMFKRILEVLGYVHSQGWVHGAVLPRNLSFHTQRHALRLTHWNDSVTKGSRLAMTSPEWSEWYPAEHATSAQPQTDIYLAAKSMIYLAGGEATSNHWPATTPPRMQRFFNACLLESPRMRPHDAWSLHEEFDELLQDLFGPRRFVELPMGKP